MFGFEDADVVETQEVARKQLLPSGSLRFTRQVKLSSRFGNSRATLAHDRRDNETSLELACPAARLGCRR